MATPLLTSPILSRTLGAEGIGIYNYSASIASYFVAASCLGINLHGIRSIALAQDNRAERDRAFSELCAVHFVESAISTLAYILYAVFLAKYRAIALILSIEVAASLLDIIWFYQGIEYFARIVFRDCLIKLTVMTAIVCFVRGQSSLTFYATLMSVSILVSNLLLWIRLNQYVSFVKVSLKRAFKVHFKQICALAIPIILQSVYSTMDKVMLESMIGAREVGFYSNATKTLVSKDIIIGLSSVMLPRMTLILRQGNKNQLQSYLARFTEINICLSCGFAFGTASVAREFAPLFWGEDFQSCAGLIMVLSVAIPFQTLSNEIRTNILIPAGKDKNYILSAIFGTICNICLNLCLIPRYQSIGAAVATVITEFLAMIIQASFGREYMKLERMLLQNGAYVVFGMIMFCAVRSVAHFWSRGIVSLLSEVTIGAGTYFILCVCYWVALGNHYLLSSLKRLLTQH